MLLTISNPFLLRLTWGRRDSYPSYVTAHHKLWMKWLYYNLVSLTRRKNVMVKDNQLVEAHKELDAAGLEIPAEFKREEVQVQDPAHVEGEVKPETVH